MSNREFDASLAWLATADNRRLVGHGLRGLEKECLRVGRDGRLSSAPHSRRFGSALTHPWITTDYSEALLEFVTPPQTGNEETLAFLADLHAFVVREGADELLWPASMPCIIPSDDAVPIAQYGSSNEGRLRTIYRSGLGVRYGRAMQAIAGTHFNYSLPPDFWPAFRDHEGSALDARAFKSDCLMRLVRNYRRCAWLLTFLYGASPAFSRSFRPEGHPRLEAIDSDTWYAPFSTSLRVSDMGYRNSTQARFSVGVNSLDEYLDGLTAALTTVDPRYAALGVIVDGEYRQLNAHVLQLENEYYSSIRPKPANKSPRLIAALRNSGVEYVEVRTLDLNPFEAVGVSIEQMRFVEVLLLYCLLEASPPIAADEQAEIDQRELAVAWEGRKPGLRLPRQGATMPLRNCALAILDSLEALTPLLDDRRALHRRAIDAARDAVHDPERTLSARVLDALRRERRSFFDWAFELAGRQREHFLRHAFAPGRLAELEGVAAGSLEAAAAREAGPEPPFASYLAELLASGVSRSQAARRNL